MSQGLLSLFVHTSRLQAMRQQRAQNERKEAAKKAKDWKQTTLEQSAKRKAQAQKQQGEKPPGGGKVSKAQHKLALAAQGVKRWVLKPL